MPLSECDFIARIRSQSAIDSDRLVLGIGDDCAVYHLSSNPAEPKFGIITTDALVESVHFDLSWHPAKLLGRKSLSVNLSDIAAMGGVPLYALLTIGMSDETPASLLDEFMDGFQGALAEHSVLLIGGDTVKSSGFMVSVTLLGEVPKDQVLYRSGAKEGDLVWVSGNLGQAAAGLELSRRKVPGSKINSALLAAHLDPTPQTALGPLLAASGFVSAMMDISDGVATDLAHICKESGVGADINAGQVPISNETSDAAAELKCSIMEWALQGGEDYELLFTSPASCGTELSELARKSTGQQISCIGRITGKEGVRVTTDGGQQEISYKGYDHFNVSS